MAKSTGAKAARQRAEHAARERQRYAASKVLDERSQWDSRDLATGVTPDKDEKQATPISHAEGLYVNQERDKCRHDFLYFYNTIFSEDVRNKRTGLIEPQRLGLFHLLLIDYLHIDLPNVKTYSPLTQYLPPRDERGFFTERWIYWRTLDAEPEIQDGADGEVSRRFYAATFWQGVMVRVCGDGFTKAALAPRGHLKSTVGGVCETAWRLIREPSDRHVIRSSGSGLAKEFLDGVKQLFETNERFQRLWGWLQPRKREQVWNTSKIQVKCRRRGMSPTIHAMGVNTEAVGTHADHYLNDDVVGEKNSMTPALRAKARQAIQKQQAQREPDSNMTVLGTRWEEDDLYQMIVGKPGVTEHSGTMASEASFFVATVLDGDTTVEVTPRISPLKCGKPIWPENWTIRTVASKRLAMDDRQFFSWYFNQFYGTSNRMFKPSWFRAYPKKYWELSPEQVARELKLDIYIGTDTGSGKPDNGGKRDNTAASVKGQDRKTKDIFDLGGFSEKMTTDEMAVAILDLAEFWYSVAQSYGGYFRIGFEKTRWTNALKQALGEEQRRRNSPALFDVEELGHGSRPKCERISWLVMPYSYGRIYAPCNDKGEITLDVPSVKGLEPYDLYALARHEFENYNPHATEDNWLDASAYAYKMTDETDWNEKVEPKPYELGQGHRKNTPFEDSLIDSVLDMGEAIAL